MIRSAPSMWRRRSRTAPTTSWSAARSARPPIRALRPRPSRRRLPLFFRSEQLLQQALEVRVDRELHAVEENFIPARHADRREVLDLEVADFIGVVLDVDPAEFDAGEFLPQGKKAGPVVDA